MKNIFYFVWQKKRNITIQNIILRFFKVKLSVFVRHIDKLLNMFCFSPCKNNTDEIFEAFILFQKYRVFFCLVHLLMVHLEYTFCIIIVCLVFSLSSDILTNFFFYCSAFFICIRVKHPFLYHSYITSRCLVVTNLWFCNCKFYLFFNDEMHFVSCSFYINHFKSKLIH